MAFQTHGTLRPKRGLLLMVVAALTGHPGPLPAADTPGSTRADAVAVARPAVIVGDHGTRVHAAMFVFDGHNVLRVLQAAVRPSRMP